MDTKSMIETIAAQRAVSDALRSQRDALAAALTDLLCNSYSKQNHGNSEDLRLVQEAARAALANLK